MLFFPTFRKITVNQLMKKFWPSLLLCFSSLAVPLFRFTPANRTVYTIKVLFMIKIINNVFTTILPSKSDSDFMFCLQSFQELRIDISLVY